MLWWYHMERGGMPLHEAVGKGLDAVYMMGLETVKRAQLLKIKAQVSSMG